MEENTRDINEGTIVQHFKRETVDQTTNEYLYEVIAFGNHSETQEKMVVYKALYPPYKVCIRPFEMFFSKVDKEKYPDIKQEYRFEKYQK